MYFYKQSYHSLSSLLSLWGCGWFKYLWCRHLWTTRVVALSSVVLCCCLIHAYHSSLPSNWKAEDSRQPCVQATWNISGGTGGTQNFAPLMHCTLKRKIELYRQEWKTCKSKNKCFEIYYIIGNTWTQNDIVPTMWKTCKSKNTCFEIY